MLVKDLVSLLLAQNADAQAFFMTQRKQPFEHEIAGVVARWEIPDENVRHEPGLAWDDVFLPAGRRIRPGSLSAWSVAERSDRPSLQWSGVLAERAADLETIEQKYIPFDPFCPPNRCLCLRVTPNDLRGALLAAYHAGLAAQLKLSSANGHAER